MPTLNRFPLLALWAREAALHEGHKPEEAAAIGHAYAVLYAIRASSPSRGAKHKGKAEGETPATPAQPATPQFQELEFCGDRLEVDRDPQGNLRGRVGHEAPQTAATFQSYVPPKFPAGYYAKVEKAFRDFFQAYDPQVLRQGRQLYHLYDQWKKSCASGRLVDLDKLIKWCEDRMARARAAAVKQKPSGSP
jgi:hypothetical protein